MIDNSLATERAVWRRGRPLVETRSGRTTMQCSPPRRRAPAPARVSKFRAVASV
ncbi:MAG: hypothetical protein ACR2G4_15570 [Pyrinomonadaceae bacterium]